MGESSVELETIQQLLRFSIATLEARKADRTRDDRFATQEARKADRTLLKSFARNMWEGEM